MSFIAVNTQLGRTTKKKNLGILKNSECMQIKSEIVLRP